VDYELWQWSLFGVAALIVGLSKCGIPGIGILNVVLFQHALLAKDATGFGLPVLVIGDICAAIAYRKHAEWPLIAKLAPWAGLGVLLGYFALGALSDELAGLLIALLLALMLAIHVYRELRKGSLESMAAGGRGASILIGLGAGFTSMIGNAAGPLMALYMLSMGFPKMRFLGVSVYFFLVLNLFKLPFLTHLDLVSMGSINANLKLIPFVVTGAFIGVLFAKHVKQIWFDRTAFWLSAAAVAHLLVSAYLRYAS